MMRIKSFIFFLIFSFIVMDRTFAFNAVINKLQRGVVNVVTAPVEVPKQVRAAWIEGSLKTMHISAWLFYGLVKGVWMTPVRIGSGLWDIITCPWDIPSNGKSLLQPEYVFNDWPQRKEGVVYKNLWDR